MKFEFSFVLSCLFVSTTAQVRGNASIKRHRLAESDSKFVDLTADISESEMLRIKQRYLSIRISAQREAISKSTIASQEDGIGGRKNKDDKNDIDKDNVEDFSIPMLMNESSMDGIGGRQGKDDKN